MQLADLSWPEIQSMRKETPVLIPVAALEQHGKHLPLFTDSMLLAEVVRRANEQIGSKMLVAPLMWLGNSDHHLDFPGTLSCPPRVYLDLLNGLVENFVRHGFKRILFINGHGGNDVPGRQSIFEMRQRYRERKDLLLLFATYWHLSKNPTAQDASFQQSEMGHACEWETSMIMRISPPHARNWMNLTSIDSRSAFEPAVRGWTTKDRTTPGHIGFPRFASAEKGEVLLQAFSSGLVDMIERMLRWDGEPWNT